MLAPADAASTEKRAAVEPADAPSAAGDSERGDLCDALPLLWWPPPPPPPLLEMWDDDEGAAAAAAEVGICRSIDATVAADIEDPAADEWRPPAPPRSLPAVGAKTGDTEREERRVEAEAEADWGSCCGLVVVEERRSFHRRPSSAGRIDAEQPRRGGAKAIEEI